MDVVVNAQIVTLPTGDPLKLRLDIADGSLLKDPHENGLAS
jgi:hypothetical protein